MTEGLGRFVSAQRGGYATALAEIQAGAKRSHWIWYIFPQIAGLGQSALNQRYAIVDLQEARAYLAHSVLCERLRTVTVAMLDWAGQRSPQTILGDIDAIKFASSMTLFEAASGGQRVGGGVYAKALDSLCDGRRDAKTLALL